MPGNHKRRLGEFVQLKSLSQSSFILRMSNDSEENKVPESENSLAFQPPPPPPSSPPWLHIICDHLFLRLPKAPELAKPKCIQEGNDKHFSKPCYEIVLSLLVLSSEKYRLLQNTRNSFHAVYILPVLKRGGINVDSTAVKGKLNTDLYTQYNLILVNFLQSAVQKENTRKFRSNYMSRQNYKLRKYQKKYTTCFCLVSLIFF